jgi:diguanylate cyclase (GGDEF)-like protein
VSRAHLAAGAVTVVLYYALDSPLAAALTYDAYGLLTLVAVVAGVRAHRPANRRPWRLIASALVLWTGTNAAVLYYVHVLGLRSATGTVADPLTAAGYVLVLAAAVALVLQGSGGDTGGVLDAAVLSIAGGTVIWEIAMYPELVALGTPGPAMALALVQLLCLTGVLGAVVRVAAVSEPARATLLYLVAALAAGLVGTVGQLLTRDEAVYVQGGWTDAMWLIGYAGMGAAALHPGMARLGAARRRVGDTLHDARLAALTTALLTAPLVVGASQLLGRAGDTLLLAVASITTVPLVMIRIRGLVHERERAERALAHQATHDALTGLANRAALLEHLHAAHRRVRDGATPGLCLLFCDLNGFKAVNDDLGHAAGDELLVAVGRRLAGAVRATDVVARFGGDEFVVLCEGASPAVVAGQVYPRIAATLQDPVRLEGGVTACVSASVGMAVCGPDDDHDVTDLLRIADAAMYAAKRRRTDGAPGSVLHAAAL